MTTSGMPRSHEGTKDHEGFCLRVGYFYSSISNNIAAFSQRIARLSSTERYSASLIVVTDRPITSGQAICSVPKKNLVTTGRRNGFLQQPVKKLIAQ